MHKETAASQRSAYLTALSQEIERKLQKLVEKCGELWGTHSWLFLFLQALNSPSHKLELLQQLFADIALEIDDRARDIILSSDSGGASKTVEITESCLCFYDVLANHFVIMPENGRRILDLIVLLWSQSFASHIYSLLFHKWLFEVPVENPEALLRYGSALVQGATNVFWIDIQTNTRRFLSLFHYLLEDVALVAARIERISLQARRDLFYLLSRFLFFYNFDHKLESFLKHFPVSANAFLVGGPADVFVIELTDQIQKLKVEPVLLHYLSRLRSLRGLELRMTTSTRLKACLYSFTSPGGPMYPTRAVRHAAWDALDLLFPVSWAISKACDKPLLQTALSMVLALIMLELHQNLYNHCFILSDYVDLFELGKDDKIEKRLKPRTPLNAHVYFVIHILYSAVRNEF
ncbi:hypothetical protein AXF42_Ash017716 [Apostasia shenzhenica]|uniref:Uncharacterized protein n=1 Tax=Apostasia shenzhenica TaxID=1088818 RepID=A0A2I0B622_9ASPA|nr:hypothetical protein AXF42_Ash017716 [Apostasia shenzhenica]